MSDKKDQEIYSFADADQVVAYDSVVAAVTVTYETVPDELIDRDESTETVVDFGNTLGDPPAESFVVYTISGDTADVIETAGVVTLVPAGELFLRGDCNADSSYNIGDVFGLLGTLFLAAGDPACEDACDVNDSGELNMIDAIYMLEDLFVGGDAPAEPYPNCGADPSDGDGLGCEDSGSCS